MNDSQRRRNDRLIRCADYGNARTADFPTGSKGAQALARLNTLGTEIASRDASSFTNLRVSQQATSRRKEARDALRSQIATISDAAETIGLDHPEVKDRFRRLTGRPDDQTLLGVARSFAAEAAAVKALFLEYDMPADFIDRLNASINELDEAIEQQNTGADAQRADKTAVETLLKQAEVELERLDTAVRIKYRDDPAALTAWESARHLERGPRKSKEASNPPPQQSK